MIAFYTMTAAIYFTPRSAMRDSKERWKDEATPRLARGASASFLIAQYSLAKVSGKARTRPETTFASLLL
jgi:alpha-beta hydrolase superfamily lysophospholipase